MPHIHLKQFTMTLAALPLAVSITLAQEKQAPPPEQKASQQEQPATQGEKPPANIGVRDFFI